MFRRRWEGLPPTPKYPTDLGQLGYFVTDTGEIRNIEKPDYYYKYFITRNPYYNDCQRFSFHTAIQRLVLARLAELDVHPVRLPLGARDDEPHVLVLASSNLATAGRVVLFVGETNQDLGVLAYRVIAGAGGIDEGSVVNMVRRVRKDSDKKATATLICNPGELFWWPEAQRSLSRPACEGMPRPSAAHHSPRAYAANTIAGHETADAHVASVFAALLADKADLRITAIAIAGGADALEAFLDDDARWARWGPHMDSLALLGGLYDSACIKTAGFRAFLRTRARAYISSEAPVDAPIAGPDGNAFAVRATEYGCPVHSAGTTWLTELMFIDAQASILAWGEAVAQTPGYTNPELVIKYKEQILTHDDLTWAGYKGEAEAEADGEAVKGPLVVDGTVADVHASLPLRAAAAVQQALAEAKAEAKAGAV